MGNTHDRKQSNQKEAYEDVDKHTHAVGHYWRGTHPLRGDAEVQIPDGPERIAESMFRGRNGKCPFLNIVIKPFLCYVIEGIRLFVVEETR